MWPYLLNPHCNRWLLTMSVSGVVIEVSIETAYSAGPAAALSLFTQPNCVHVQNPQAPMALWIHRQDLLILVSWQILTHCMSWFLWNSHQPYWMKAYGSGHERCACFVTWFCYQMAAKPGNKTDAPLWPDPYAQRKCIRNLRWPKNL